MRRKGLLIQGPDNAQRVNLENLFLEYRSTQRTARPGLLQKYLALLTPHAEVPKLWTLAAGSIYPALRSRYGTLTVEIDNRDSAEPFPPQVRQPWLDDVVRVLLYDFGAHMSIIPEHTAEIWGVSREELWARALSNLRALARPHWEPLGSVVFQLVSEVAYEETFPLVEEVVDALPVTGHPVCAIPNRGVLLAADGTDPAALKALIAESRHRLENGPWPLSGLLIERTPTGWRRYNPPAELAQAAGSLRALDLARTYLDQKAVLDKLHERTGTDVFVATFALRSQQHAPDQIQSGCTWSAGVETLLPKTDHIVLNRDPGSSHPDLLFVPWSTVERLGGHYLKTTSEDPPRFRVDAFPTPDEWTALQATTAGGVM
jgi:hypothetical protein